MHFVATILCNLVLSSGPIACNGPSLDLPLLQDCKLVKVTLGSSWNQGIYTDVTLTYKSSQPYDSFLRKHVANYVAAYDRKGMITSAEVQPLKRQSGSITQICTIGHFTGNKGQVEGALITVREEVEVSRGMPLRWNRKAIDAKLPFGIEQVPFLIGRTILAMSSRKCTPVYSRSSPIRTLVRYPRDTRIYEVTVPDSVAMIQAVADAWAANQGFAKQGAGVYFKRQAGCFEVSVSPQGNGSMVRWCVSKQKPDQPPITIRRR